MERRHYLFDHSEVFLVAQHHSHEFIGETVSDTYPTGHVDVSETKWVIDPKHLPEIIQWMMRQGILRP